MAPRADGDEGHQQTVHRDSDAIRDLGAYAHSPSILHFFWLCTGKPTTPTGSTTPDLRARSASPLAPGSARSEAPGSGATTCTRRVPLDRSRGRRGGDGRGDVRPAHDDFPTPPVAGSRRIGHLTSAPRSVVASAGEWVKTNGRPTLIRNAKVTSDEFPVAAVACVRARGMKDAWCLASSLSDASASVIIALYSRRFTIEENFRDTKDPRFGLGLSSARVSAPQRRDRLLLIGSPRRSSRSSAPLARTWAWTACSRRTR